MTKYRVPSTEYRVPSTEYRVLSTEYRVPSTEYRVPSTEYRVPSTEYRVLFLTPDYRGAREAANPLPPRPPLHQINVLGRASIGEKRRAAWRTSRTRNCSADFAREMPPPSMPCATGTKRPSTVS